GRRRFFERKQDAEAWLGQYGRLHRKRRRAPTDHPTVGEFVKRVAEKRKGACADGTYAILNTQLGYLDAYEVRPGVRLTDLRLEALDGDGDLILDLLKWQANRGFAVDSIRLLRNAVKEVLDRAMSQGYHQIGRAHV